MIIALFIQQSITFISDYIICFQFLWIISTQDCLWTDSYCTRQWLSHNACTLLHSMIMALSFCMWCAHIDRWITKPVWPIIHLQIKSEKKDHNNKQIFPQILIQDTINLKQIIKKMNCCYWKTYCIWTTWLRWFQILLKKGNMMTKWHIWEFTEIRWSYNRHQLLYSKSLCFSFHF